MTIPGNFEQFPPLLKETRGAKREYKFLAPIELLDDIRDDITPYVCYDKYAELREEKHYTVRSIYYDTPTFRCYDEKAEGLIVKKKYRIRGYDEEKETNTVFLEIKRKYENLVAKNRAPLKWDRTKMLFSEQIFADQGLACNDDFQEENVQRFFYNYYRKKLLPTVLVSYEREAFYSKFDCTLRITIDKNIRSLLYPSLKSLYVDEAQYAMPRHFIFEVKFYRGLPLWIRSLVTRYELFRLSLSKYTICIDSHRIVGKFCPRVSHIVELYGYEQDTGG